MEVKKRIQWIDVLRGVGILLVVAGHTQIPIHKYIYGFHMPLFFFISGYLWKSTNRVRFCSYFRRYIIPYFILCAINLMICVPMKLVQGERFSIVRKYLAGILYSRGTVEWMPNCSPLWFLTAIFFSSILFDLLDILTQKRERERERERETPARVCSALRLCGGFA